MKRVFITGQILFQVTISCLSQSTPDTGNTKSIRLVTLDPGHFHAALVQKTMYPTVDPTVYIYAPPGADVQLHLDRINAYNNNRKEQPTVWKETVYTGHDYLERLLAEKAGNVVVISGNNQKKTEYIQRLLTGGLHVLADKPMAINTKGFEVLKSAFKTAEDKGLLLYDIMTERFEITTMLQKELSMIPQVFGTLQKGSPEQPAVTKESVHNFYKFVSGNVLTRPAWFMDVAQQGEGIVDVTTHLVDLVQWECFPEQALDYRKDIQVLSAKRWPTHMTLNEFKAITKLDQFPGYLQKDVVQDTILKVFSNGEINYRLRGIHAKVKVTWDYKAPEGAGDTHYSIMRGTKANLVIKQGAEQNFIPALYIEPLIKDDSYASGLEESFRFIQTKYPDITLKKQGNAWEVIIPAKYREGHEAHFSRVMENFLGYLQNGNMPTWEVPNMLAKYYTTTKALEMAQTVDQSESTNSLIADGATLQLVSDQFSFTEGPAVDKKGNVYFTDQPNNKIWKYGTDGKLSLFMENAGRSNGLYIDKKGNIISCADENNELWSISADKKVTVLLKDYLGKKLNGPNDLWINANGGIYFTDPYYQRSYWTRKEPEIQGQKVYFLPKGKREPIIVEDQIKKPNGIVGTPDGKYLYVADIADNKTYRYSTSPDGTLKDRQLFVAQGSDGITLDNKSNLYLTGNGVTVYDQEGNKIAHIPVPAKWTANLCFFGKDRNKLFITASKAVYTLDMKVKGVE